MNKSKSSEEIMKDQYNAIMRELYKRKEEIIGGRLDCLTDIDINITIHGCDDPKITITRGIVAIPGI